MAYTDNIIPTMTSNTAPSGEVESSGIYNASYPAWKAFDHDNSTPYCWLADATTGWIAYWYGALHVITRYAITTRNDQYPNAPKTWTFQGHNGTTWVTLDTQTTVTDWATTPTMRKVFDFANTTAYYGTRLLITASNDANYVGVGELETMESYLDAVALATDHYSHMRRG